MLYMYVCIYIHVYMFAGNLSSCCIHLCIQSIVTCSKLLYEFHPAGFAQLELTQQITRTQLKCSIVANTNILLNETVHVLFTSNVTSPPLTNQVTLTLESGVLLADNSYRFRIEAIVYQCSGSHWVCRDRHSHCLCPSFRASQQPTTEWKSIRYIVHSPGFAVDR